METCKQGYLERRILVYKETRILGSQEGRKQAYLQTRKLEIWVPWKLVDCIYKLWFIQIRYGFIP
jgi:hypothetical protein